MAFENSQVFSMLLYFVFQGKVFVCSVMWVMAITFMRTLSFMYYHKKILQKPQKACKGKDVGRE